MPACSQSRAVGHATAGIARDLAPKCHILAPCDGGVDPVHAGTTARDTEGENWHSSLGQNYTVWVSGLGVLVDFHLYCGRVGECTNCRSPPYKARRR